MPWNWQLPNWPKFTYHSDQIAQTEKQFLLGIGSAFAYMKTIDKQEHRQFVVEMLSTEGLESSKIEGEILDRESLQSSIKQHFGLQVSLRQKDEKESNMAALLCNVYESFDEPLTHEMLCKWHAMLFKGSTDLADIGRYRTHTEPMQIVSQSSRAAVVFFEAPPSTEVIAEMTVFIEWFNSCDGSESILCRAAIAHLYFESIHPFEDGNGRIGRILVEKILSQGVGHPTLIAVSKTLENNKKKYYSALEKCNRTLEVHAWVGFFSSMVLEAQKESINLLYFLIQKSKILNAYSDQINPRQLKALLRIFAEGPKGFDGGLSAENYISITKASRPTATRDLTDLVEKGILVKTGELRHTRYQLNLPTRK
ncbi:MAG: Fic family protein [Rhabdochlamydiaceae bacterium]|nr:Fic family protein [Rhabdochlamydiaceae bacterium]